MNNFCIKNGYISRNEIRYFLNESNGDVIWQQSIYDYAKKLSEELNSDTIIDIGCGYGKKLVELSKTKKIIGIDFGPNIEFCKKNYSFGKWIESDLSKNDPISISPLDYHNAIVICSDVIEHLKNPMPLIEKLKSILEFTKCVVISTPERDLTRGIKDFGPPANPHHIREWNLEEFKNFLIECGFNIECIKLMTSNNKEVQPKTIMAVINTCIK